MKKNILKKKEKEKRKGYFVPRKGEFNDAI